MKKAGKFSILIMVLLVACAAVLPVAFGTNNAYAAENAKLKCSSATVHRGQTFSVDVTLEGNTGLTSLLMFVKYDSSAMQLVSVQPGEALASLTYINTHQSEWDNYNRMEGIRFIWEGAQQDSTNGVLLTLVFDSFLTAEVGNYPIVINYDPANTGSSPHVPATLTVSNGAVSIVKGRFSVQYFNYDGTLLYEKDFNDGEEPTYVGAKPTRVEDEQFSYKFIGWQGMVSSDSNVIKKVAEYELSPREYDVWFYVDGEYFDAVTYAFGTEIDVTHRPKKDNYTFIGWFLDENFTEKLHSTLMPAHNLKLYGYLKYNIREDNIPEIKLEVSSQEGGIATVDVNMTINTGIASMKLTLEYDRQYLTLKGFKRGDVFSGAFAFTNGDKISLGEDGYFRAKVNGALDANPFVFQIENNTGNSTELGIIFTLQFEIASNAPIGMYNVGLTYNSKSDVTYFNEDNEIWYSEVDLKNTSIPVGEKNHWNEKADGDDIAVDVTSSEPMPANTVMTVEDVSGEIRLSGDYLDLTIGEDMEIKKAYSVSLLQNNVVVSPEGDLQVRIKLTEQEKQCEELKLYTVNKNGTLSLCASSVEGDEIVFTTENLGTYAIVGNARVTVVTPSDNDDGPNFWLYVVIGMGVLILILIIMLIVVSNKKKKPARPAQSHPNSQPPKRY